MIKIKMTKLEAEFLEKQQNTEVELMEMISMLGCEKKAFWEDIRKKYRKQIGKAENPHVIKADFKKRQFLVD